MPRNATRQSRIAQDDDDDASGKPMQIRRGVGEWPATRTAVAPTRSPFDAGAAAKPRRVAAPKIDFDAVEIEHGIPIPPPRTAGGGYAQLLARLSPGDSVLLPSRNANGLVAALKKAKRKAAIRNVDEHSARVWLVE